ncbi:hypothetical protein SAMN05216321_10197 [Cupriavidus sp. OV038]|uniref:DUF5675 family protein n=1 Tax=unclassified Cupriavidus TaxID=2640874 RepID=UPI0008E76B32|nr:MULTISPECIES: DUF5675 family protein [unclassified Cupriavidus]SFB68337.1 hypothetical protein SAMN05216321_10197 [Cupriavidus sp. OV038]SFO57570.1 hypothetical protein SAMN05216322_10197 [Cupriavidus sp. OV096]
MRMLLRREPSTARATLGRLYVNGNFQCYTLEDVVRPTKVKGQTAIPAGTYAVIVNMSGRFRRRLPLLLNVPSFEGVRIHPGNTAADTEGCILPGSTLGADAVFKSRAAFEPLFARIDGALARKEGVTIEIVDGEGGE